MSASLVGSEMCIRDSINAEYGDDMDFMDFLKTTGDEKPSTGSRIAVAGEDKTRLRSTPPVKRSLSSNAVAQSPKEESSEEGELNFLDMLRSEPQGNNKNNTDNTDNSNLNATRSRSGVLTNNNNPPPINSSSSSNIGIHFNPNTTNSNTGGKVLKKKSFIKQNTQIALQHRIKRKKRAKGEGKETQRKREGER
eukprot:TRINITY_DN4442_c0_g10_i1.p1 TRINITY_DN4442_c0_g10~~TRINITY_DN4442_c0_g10_i1.p1  ORF type:complete len:194 (-),score=71.28 TRINITY_DN4442_c0_g10_i1:67-648(-)